MKKFVQNLFIQTKKKDQKQTKKESAQKKRDVLHGVVVIIARL